MLLSSPVWRGTAKWWFVAGLLAGGAGTALMVNAVASVLVRSWLPVQAGVGLTIVALVLVGLNEFGVVRLPLPQNARQVPQTIGAARQMGALQFGLEMGSGMRTFMTSGLPHVLAVAVIVVLPWYEAILAGLLFGAGRAWMTLSRLYAADELEWDERLARHDATLRRMLTAAAGAALLTAVI